jgi:hypothetical protein
MHEMIWEKQEKNNKCAIIIYIRNYWVYSKL